MREILFRGKATHGLNAGDWIYGYYVKDFWMPTSHGFGILPIDEKKGGYCEVAPETIGQYTGFTDNNGTKIFEGDILEVDVSEYEEASPDEFSSLFGSIPNKRYTGRKIKALWSVEYKEHRCRGNGFYVYGINRRFNTTLTQSTIFNSNPVVIGNIHDNPELLKGGEEE
jgi:uncharacterized phage protein (TIGR01671 family)